MQEEIKEILDKLNNMMIFDENLIGWQIDGNGTTISKKDFKILLDYITNLQEKYDKTLELLVDFNMPCEIDDFNLLDTDYCELNCSVDDEQYKKCWNKFIEWRLQGVDKE